MLKYVTRMNTSKHVLAFLYTPTVVTVSQVSPADGFSRDRFEWVILEKFCTFCSLSFANTWNWMECIRVKFIERICVKETFGLWTSQCGSTKWPLLPFVQLYWDTDPQVPLSEGRRRRMSKHVRPLSFH